MRIFEFPDEMALSITHIRLRIAPFQTALVHQHREPVVVVGDVELSPVFGTISATGSD